MTRNEISNNKRIAKNTIMLYIRMLLSMVVSLYTSRVVLNTLGVEDYGIYGVVGGVVAMFSFLNASMSGATSRFLTFEMGRGDEQRLRDTFSSALLVHFGIAFVVLLLAETVGLWFLIHKLVIPEERMFAAHVVYQLSILSTMVSITQVPYNATIIAHEKMDIYAYVELLNVSLKLLIVFLLPIIGSDKLIVYGILVFLVSILIALIYRGYCFKRYQESHFKFIFSKNIIYPMLSFSGWDLYGNMGFTVRQQGLSFIINIFFGPALNAASAIASTVQGVLLSLINNIIIAFRPQIVKKYSQNEIVEMNDLMIIALQLCIILFGILTIPMLFEISYIFKLWLVNIPYKCIEIARIILLTNLFVLINLLIIVPIHATGRIKVLSFVCGTFNWGALLPVYLIFYCGGNIETAYWVIFILTIINQIAILYILKRNITDINLLILVKYGFLKLVPLFFVSFLSINILYHILQEGIFRLVFLYSINTILFIGYTFTIIFTRKQQNLVLVRIKSIFKK